MGRKHAACELCAGTGGTVLFQHALLRVVLVDDDLYPGFCRVIWQDHVPEMTDLPFSKRAFFMQTVWQVEQTLREVLKPKKINLASLGNLTPHLHWHVIARFEDDAHYPNPVWGQQQRVPTKEWLELKTGQRLQVQHAVAANCASLASYGVK